MRFVVFSGLISKEFGAPKIITGIMSIGHLDGVLWA